MRPSEISWRFFSKALPMASRSTTVTSRHRASEARTAAMNDARRGTDQQEVDWRRPPAPRQSRGRRPDLSGFLEGHRQTSVEAHREQLSPLPPEAQRDRRKGAGPGDPATDPDAAARGEAAQGTEAPAAPDRRRRRSISDWRRPRSQKRSSKLLRSGRRRSS